MQFVCHDHTTEPMNRLGDIAFACLLLLFCFPLLLIVALAIRLESPGPVLERATCIGAGGRRFEMLKFRTEMCGSGRGGPPWARPQTRTGAFLRYTRIEYLPQLVNVLRGDLGILDRQRRSPSFLH
jgi:lipopolysaccharide/colanic/teichoic acid biosynthesis glycosyltransferase